MYWKEKTQAAYDGGCRRFDGALMGFGGCPMAKDDLVGNIATENLIHLFNEAKVDEGNLAEAMSIAQDIFQNS